ncbi:MAG: hypthetical protein SCD63.18c, partial [uncultured Pseudonocardia sp.]
GQLEGRRDRRARARRPGAGAVRRAQAQDDRHPAGRRVSADQRHRGAVHRRGARVRVDAARAQGSGPAPRPAVRAAQRHRGPRGGAGGGLAGGGEGGGACRARRPAGRARARRRVPGRPRRGGAHRAEPGRYRPADRELDTGPGLPRGGAGV